MLGIGDTEVCRYDDDADMDDDPNDADIDDDRNDADAYDDAADSKACVDDADADDNQNCCRYAPSFRLRDQVSL